MPRRNDSPAKTALTHRKEELEDTTSSTNTSRLQVITAKVGERKAVQDHKAITTAVSSHMAVAKVAWEGECLLLRLWTTTATQSLEVWACNPTIRVEHHLTQPLLEGSMDHHPTSQCTVDTHLPISMECTEVCHRFMAAKTNGEWECLPLVTFQARTVALLGSSLRGVSWAEPICLPVVRSNQVCPPWARTVAQVARPHTPEAEHLTSVMEEDISKERCRQ